MLSFQGYFESGKFVSLDNISIPENKRAIVTILDEVVPQKRESHNAKAWREFFTDLEGCNELPAEFDEVVSKRVNFTREIDL